MASEAGLVFRSNGLFSSGVEFGSGIQHIASADEQRNRRCMDEMEL